MKYLGLDRDLEAPYLDISLVVRSSQDPVLLAMPVERAIREVDPNLPVSDIKTIDSLLAQSAAPRRFNAILLALFSALVCLLAFGGLYRTLLYRRPASRRGQQIGWDRHRNWLSGGGLALSRSQRPFFGISPVDPLIYTMVAVGMLLTAALASSIPAWRASRVDPMTALRSE